MLFSELEGDFCRHRVITKQMKTTALDVSTSDIRIWCLQKSYWTRAPHGFLWLIARSIHQSDSRQPNLRDLIESGPWLCYISLIASSFKLLVARWIFFWDLRKHFLLNWLASIFSSPPSLPWTMIHSTLYCIGSSVQYVLFFLVLLLYTNRFTDSRRCLV